MITSQMQIRRGTKCERGTQVQARVLVVAEDVGGPPSGYKEVGGVLISLLSLFGLGLQELPLLFAENVSTARNPRFYSRYWSISFTYLFAAL
jgi:hypothetical protein